MPLPGRVFIPVHGILRDRHDIGLTVSVDIRDRHRVANIADMVVNLLGNEPRSLGHDSRYREAQPEDRGQDHESHRSLRESLVGTGKRSKIIKNRPFLIAARYPRRLGNQGHGIVDLPRDFQKPQ